MPCRLLMLLLTVISACRPGDQNRTSTPATEVLRPVVITEPVEHDTDDPAIWIHPTDPARSLILGTDKDSLGALYVYDLNGKILGDKVVRGLRRPNNVDVEYGFDLGGQPTDIAVVTERLTNRLRIFSIPNMKPIDGGGLPVFEGEAQRAPMGVALYKRPTDGAVFAIVGRKEGPVEGYLWQYRLHGNPQGVVTARIVRKFGAWSGKKEIESIAVDDPLGYVYYSDETVGVRQYSADPASGSKELALFATRGFGQDHEGISIYQTGKRTGYILVSDQQNAQFHLFRREGTPARPYAHRFVKKVRLSVQESDGSEVTNCPLDRRFPGGMLAAMSSDRTFHFYAWKDLISPGSVQKQ